MGEGTVHDTVIDGGGEGEGVKLALGRECIGFEPIKEGCTTEEAAVWVLRCMDVCIYEPGKEKPILGRAENSPLGKSRYELMHARYTVHKCNFPRFIDADGALRDDVEGGEGPTVDECAIVNCFFYFSGR